jgi:hypothetical protein
MLAAAACACLPARPARPACRDLELSVQQSLAQEAELDAASPQFVGQADAREEENVLTLEEYEAQQQGQHAQQAQQEQEQGAGGTGG